MTCNSIFFSLAEYEWTRGGKTLLNYIMYILEILYLQK